MPTLGEHLVNDILPPGYRVSGPLTSGKLQELLVEIAKKHPDKYPEVVTKLKRLGDHVATLDGVSVGLADVRPDVKLRDATLQPFQKQFQSAKTDAEREKALVAGQQAMVELTKQHGGSMGDMARSGGRGSMEQLVRIVAAPVAATDEAGKVVPHFIGRSFAEGLRPVDAWVAGNEARINAIKSATSVVEPGDLAKILVNNMSDQLITKQDCGTKNGISMRTDDPHILDRYLAHATARYPAGTLITPQVKKDLAAAGTTAIVRSPMTCEAHDGICQMCRGLDPSGKMFPLGTNVGMRSAQALAEPLTQLALSAKHGGSLAKASDTVTVGGLKGVRQMIEIPNAFLHKAALASADGTVRRIEAAPQGGTYIWVNEDRHYITPELKPIVKIGDAVEAGDALSNGVPKPDEVIAHKGLGAGRKYVVDALHGIYAGDRIQLDKRHFETLAKQLLNHVEVTAVPDDADHGLVRGDVVHYNTYKSALKDSRKTVPLSEAVGETLAENVLHFTAGTRITPSVKTVLEQHEIKGVAVADNAPTVAPVMYTATRNPLLNPDWMARLAHRYLGESLIQGAHRGDISDTQSAHPVPAYAAGTQFGLGRDGKY